MRFSTRFLSVLALVLGLAVLTFLFLIQHFESQWVLTDLAERTRLIASSVQDGLAAAVETGSTTSVRHFLHKVTVDSALDGALICLPDKRPLDSAGTVPDGLNCSALSERMQTLGTAGFIHWKGASFYRATFPLRGQNGDVLGYLILFPGQTKIAHHMLLIGRYGLLALILVFGIVGCLALWIHYWSLGRPTEQLTAALKALLTGDRAKFKRLFMNSDFAPLVKNLDEVLKQIDQQKLGLSPANGNLWTSRRLRDLVRNLFGETPLCVIANREPYIHNRKGKKIELLLPASGLVTAVEPIVRACSGVWIGHGSGSADRETSDRRGVILVPPDKPEYALKRVWLSPQEEQGYYYGFSNEGIWPLCHIAHTRPLFRKRDFDYYTRVNRKFAAAFLEEMKMRAPIALIQDYHFALLPEMIRREKPHAVLSLFWHIPWPNPEVFGICPWKNELLRGMLGADLIGFQTQYHCNNFLDTADRFLEARVDRETFSVTVQGHTCYVKPFPISIEWPPRNNVSADRIPSIRAEALDFLSLPQETLLAVGVDRLDYTKGIVERFLAVERLLELHPELIGRFVLLQISAPSRTHIKRYQDLDTEVREQAARINFRFRRRGYEPILNRIAHHTAEEVFRFYRAANVCIVTSLHDGMNLVAKEFIASRSDEQGMLVLSSFTGAARELNEALIVNPYDIEDVAHALYRGLTMDPAEQRDRMNHLRNYILSHNVYAWAGQFLEEIARISQTVSHREEIAQTAIGQ